MSMIILLQLTS